ncbi:hypothetical protein [Halodurantibacterium flavum]|uniref:Uncharacterized protein n=1 Tax=Halodurantibacterium flavum TaxID=1382802 RepID=A0ABW4S757_9RHOB
MAVDLMLVAGLVLAGFGIVLIAGAYADERRPRSGFVLTLLGAGLIGGGFYLHPGPAAPGLIAEAVIHVLARIVN